MSSAVENLSIQLASVKRFIPAHGIDARSQGCARRAFYGTCTLSSFFSSISLLIVKVAINDKVVKTNGHLVSHLSLSIIQTIILLSFGCFIEMVLVSVCLTIHSFSSGMSCF